MPADPTVPLRNSSHLGHIYRGIKAEAHVGTLVAFKSMVDEAYRGPLAGIMSKLRTDLQAVDATLWFGTQHPDDTEHCCRPCQKGDGQLTHRGITVRVRGNVIKPSIAIIDASYASLAPIMESLFHEIRSLGAAMSLGDRHPNDPKARPCVVAPFTFPPGFSSSGAWPYRVRPPYPYSSWHWRHADPDWGMAHYGTPDPLPVMTEFNSSDPKFGERKLPPPFITKAQRLVTQPVPKRRPFKGGPKPYHRSERSKWCVDISFLVGRLRLFPEDPFLRRCLSRAILLRNKPLTSHHTPV